MKMAKKSKSITRFNEFFDHMDTCIVNRTSVIRQLKFAVACGEHLIIEGKAGIAKSYLANLFLDNITHANTFKVQCTKKMSEDYLVGALDMKIFREQGIMRHRTENTLIDCDYAFVDEIFDLSAGSLRGLLEVLNERTFTRGVQFEKAKLKTCIAATNFNKDDEDELAAVIDRFMFRAEVHNLSSKKHKMKMLTMETEMITMDISDIQAVHKKMKEVTIPKDVLNSYLSILSDIPNITDRSLKKGLKVLRASAVMAGRATCVLQDLEHCELCFCISGSTKSAAEYASAMTAYGHIIADLQLQSKAQALFNRLRKLDSILAVKLADDTFKYADMEAEAREVATIGACADALLPASIELRSRIQMATRTVLLAINNKRESERVES